MNTAGETYTPQEVAAILKIAKNTVYELIKRGELKGFKVGKKVRVNKKDVDAYLNRGSDSPSSRPSASLQPTLTQMEEKPRLQNSGYDLILSGQDLILDILARFLELYPAGVRPLRSYSGSYTALTSLYLNQVQVATAHLWDGDTGEYNISYVKKLVPGTPVQIWNLAGRMAGFYVRKGNPLKILTWRDLARGDVVMINREKGSGIRILLDEHLRKLSIPSAAIRGYSRESTSHTAVASTVARKGADVGIGNEKAGLQVSGIDFIPLQEEQYDLIIRKEDLSRPGFQAVLEIIRSEEFRQELEGLGGYNLKNTGKLMAEL
jgi:putative molybdopterin biosynthesis protein